VNTLATRIVAESTGKTVQADKSMKNPAAVSLGRLGGLKSVKARMEKISSERGRVSIKEQIHVCGWPMFTIDNTLR